MGRQIQFFMVGQDQNDFINLVFDSGDYFINDFGENITLEDINNTKCGLWIVSQQSKIIKRPGGSVDDDRVDGIQYHRSLIWESTPYYPHKNVQDGRLWVQLKYYSFDNTKPPIITKEKWLEDKYNRYKRWIIQNSRIDKDKMFYIGRTTYLLYKQGIKMMQGPKTMIEFD